VKSAPVRADTPAVRRALLAVAAVAAVAAIVAPSPAAVARPVPEAPGCPDFPADSYWHADVRALPVHPSSATYLASIGLDAEVHADFGSGLWDGGPIGIPYTVADASTPRVQVTFDYADESDPGPYPIPANAPIEGGPDSDGDRHVLVVDRDACRLYELYAAYPNGDGTWRAGSGAQWDLRSNALRPATWTSADAAGLPILPGLVRYDEVAAGVIDHAIRVTVPATQDSFVWPARHQAGDDDPSLPPMGLRLRLKASVDVAGFPVQVQPILRAMQTYGLIVADNGSPWYLSGAPDERWDNDVLHAMDVLTGRDFEAVDTSSLPVSPDSGQVAGASTPPPPADLGAYVDAVYRDFLGRAPDAGGRAHWAGRLAAGLPRSQFTLAVARSPEWLGAAVTFLYDLALGRAPDGAGLEHWRGQLAAGLPVADVAAVLLGSDESFSLGGGTPEGYVDRLYQRVLGRAADEGGRASWVAAIRAGQPRSVLAGALFQSEEHRTSRVVGTYARFLGRSPDAPGRAYWVGQLLRVDDVLLAALLAASDEYLARATWTLDRTAEMHENT
jgi:hypothetical protein